MPPKSKKQKTQAGDFTKSRLKVGKGKQVASNHTSTAFTAKPITLPNQAVNKSQISLSDLLAHLNHPNANTRKDAIHQLTLFVKSENDISSDTLTSIIPPIVRLIGASESLVRSKVIDFVSFLMSFEQGVSSIILHHILLHAVLTLSHILLPPKLDALKLIQTLFSSPSRAVRQSVVQGLFAPTTEGQWGPKVLDSILGFLGSHSVTNVTTSNPNPSLNGATGTTTGFSVDLSSASRLSVLKTLHHFLYEALEPSENPFEDTDFLNLDFSFFASSFKSDRAFLKFKRSLKPILPESIIDIPADDWSFPAQKELDWADVYPLFDTLSLDSTIDLSSNIPSTSAASTTRSKVAIEDLTRLLPPPLLTVFLESAPHAFSPTTFNNPNGDSGVHFQIILHIFRCLRTIFRATNRTGKLADMSVLEKLVIHAAAYFPMTDTVGTGRGSGDRKKDTKEMNTAWCEMVTLVVSLKKDGYAGGMGPEGEFSKVVSGKKRKREDERIQKVEGLVDEVKDFVRATLDDQDTTVEDYISLLPTIWATISLPLSLSRQSTSSIADQTFINVLNHFSSCPKNAPLKGVAFEFIKAIWIIQTSRQRRKGFEFRELQREHKLKVNEWILSIPKWAWEIGATNPALTKSIFTFLASLTHNLRPLVTVPTLSQICHRLTPFFYTIHPSKGNIIGPFVKCDKETKFVVMDAVTSLVEYESERDGLGLGDAMKTVVEKHMQSLSCKI